MKFLFEPNMSLFDIMCISTVGVLASSVSWWLILAIIPCAAISVKFERKYNVD